MNQCHIIGEVVNATLVTISTSIMTCLSFITMIDDTLLMRMVSLMIPAWSSTIQVILIHVDGKRAKTMTVMMMMMMIIMKMMKTMMINKMIKTMNDAFYSTKNSFEIAQQKP